MGLGLIKAKTRLFRRVFISRWRWRASNPRPVKVFEMILQSIVCFIALNDMRMKQTKPHIIES